MLQIVASSLGSSARQQALCSIAARQLVQQPAVWWPQQQQQQQTAGFASEGGGSKRVSAYNLFVKAEWPRFKEQGLKLGDAAAELGRLYKQLPPDQLAAWKQKADELSPERPVKEKPPPKWTGYTLYVKDAMPKLKARIPTGGSFFAKDAMKELGAAWKSMPENIKSQWKERAEELRKAQEQ